MDDDSTPLLRAKRYDQPSVFQPANLLREGRRQRGRPDIAVPAVCLLDPDGDIVRHLIATGTGREHPGWACYHTTLWTLDLDGTEVGVIGCAVGAPFAVLVAEQLFVSGCELLISVTSSGSITSVAEAPYFVRGDPVTEVVHAVDGQAQTFGRAHLDERATTGVDLGAVVGPAGHRSPSSTGRCATRAPASTTCRPATGYRPLAT